MAGNTVKDMTTNFGKLDKFEGHDFRRWQKKMHFLLTTLKVVYVLSTPMPELLEDATVEAIRIRAKWKNDDYICRGHILNGMSDTLFYVYTNVEPAKELWDSLESKYMVEDASSKKFLVDAVAWWIDSGVTTHVCKDRCWFKTYDPVKDKYVLYMGDDHFAPVHGKGSMTLEFSSGKTITLFNVLYVPKLLENLVSGPILNKCGYKRVYESDKYILSKSGVFVGFRYYNNGIFMLNLNKVPDDSDSVYMFCCVYLLHAKDEALDKFRIYKTEVELQQNDLIKTLRTDRGGEYYDHVFFQSIGIIHETTTPYTPQQNGVTERKNRALKKMVNSMLSYSGLSDGLWGESMLTAYYLLNKVLNKRNKTTPYELWYKKRPNLSYLRVWGCRAVVRLSDPKKKTLGVKGIDCMFVGYAQHSKAYRFYVFEPNDSVSINSIIESRDAIFDENYFSSIPRPKDIIPNSVESQRDDHFNDVPSETPEPCKGKRVRKAKSYGFDFQLYLAEWSRDQVGSQYSYCYSIKEDPRTYNEAMQSRDAAFWKEAIDDEIGFIMETVQKLSNIGNQL
ncbi:zinc finger, CCHC-type containing protein [Tanacetum coccineum]